MRIATRVQVAAAVMLLGLGACADDDRQAIVAPGAATEVELGVQASDLNKAIGDTVAVGVYARSSDGTVVGALQGYLRYDADQLEFAGQIPDQPGSLVIINESRADQGEIRLASLHPTGLTERVATFAFIVRGPTWSASPRFESEVVGTVHGVELRTRSARAVTEDASMPASGARHMSHTDWAIFAQPSLARESGLSSLTGLPPEGTLYGDATLNGSINTFDTAEIANVSVGNRELIIGTNSVPGNGGNPVDRVTASNVRPSNAANSCLPGFDDGATCTGRTINVFDAQPVSRESVGIDEAIVGDPIALPKAVYVSGDTTFLNAQTISGTFNMTADRLYVLQGVINVGAEAGTAGEIVVEAGTRIEGDSLSAIYVTRNGRLIADGTASQPITFSCLDDQRGPGTGRFAQCWGGVFIAGNAVLNEQQASLPTTAPAIPGRNPVAGGNQREGEGGAVNYGGSNDADSSGVIRYARFLYGGRNVTPNNELNNLTIGACGSGTVLEYIQVHSGSDDGIEFFGGRCNLKHLVATANDDDQLDYSFGYDGNIQHVVLQMTSVAASGGDKGHEVDNTETSATYNNLPRVNAQVYNVTYIGEPVAAAKTKTALHYRRGAGGTLRNLVIVGAATAFQIDNTETCTLSVNNVVLIDVTTTLSGSAGCTPSVIGANIASQGAGTQLRDPYDVLLPDFRPTDSGITVGFSPATPPNNGFFDTSATYFGGVAPEGLSGNNIPWYAGWIVGWESAVVP